MSPFTGRARRLALLPLVILLAGLPADLQAAAGSPGSRKGPGREAALGPIATRLVRGHGSGIDASGRAVPFSPPELRMYAGAFAINLDADPPEVRVWMKLDPASLPAARAEGARIQGRIRKLASAIVPLPSLKGLARLPGIEWIRVTPRYEAELNVSIPEALNAVAGVNEPPFHGALGGNVIVGLVDSGIDLDHEDFINPDGTTRLLGYWNQTDNCGSPPPGFTYGCAYSQADIDSYLGGAGSITAPDGAGHGTHVIGIAAGNGRGTGGGEPAGTYVGMAPRADIVAVKFLVEPGAASCAQCDPGDAVMYIDALAAAAGMPWSVNFSFGNQYWDHQGGDPTEIFIDSMTGPGIAGKIITKSAGNSRDSGIHIQGTASAGATNLHQFVVPSYTPIAGTFNDIHVFNLWYEPGDDLTLTVTGPTGGTFSASTGAGFGGVGTADGVIIIDGSGSPSPGGIQLLTVELDDQLGIAPRPGVWSFEVTGNTIVDGDYHAWTWLSGFGAFQVPASWSTPDHSHTLSSPATAQNVTAVGAYMSRTSWPNSLGGTTSYTSPPPVGEIAPFSSRGPTADGRQSPHVAAPGMAILSSLADTAAPGVDPLRQASDLVHWGIEGTSMSAPHVTGSAALVLGLRPCLDAIQIRDDLQDSARTDGFTGAVPNTTWGSGKLDVGGLLRMAAKHVGDLRPQANHTTYEFTDLGASIADNYNVYRGDIGDLMSGTTGAFLVTATVGAGTGTFDDPSSPAAGTGYFYVVEGEKSGVKGVRSFSFDCLPAVTGCTDLNSGLLTPWNTGC